MANYNFYLIYVRTDDRWTTLYTFMNQVKKLLFSCILVFLVKYTGV